MRLQLIFRIQTHNIDISSVMDLVCDTLHKPGRVISVWVVNDRPVDVDAQIGRFVAAKGVKF